MSDRASEVVLRLSLRDAMLFLLCHAMKTRGSTAHLVGTSGRVFLWDVPPYERDPKVHWFLGFSKDFCILLLLGQRIGGILDFFR